MTHPLRAYSRRAASRRRVIAAVSAATLICASAAMSVAPAAAAEAPGQFTRYPLSVPPVDQMQMTAGPDGNVWFTQWTSQTSITNSVSKITPEGVVTSYPIGGTPAAAPGALAAGPDGNIWFSESGRSMIGKMSTDGVLLAEYPTPINPGTGMRAMVSGPDNSIWFGQALGGKIGKISMDGTVTVFPLGVSFLTFVQGIAVGPDGNIWFTTFTGSSIVGKLTPSGTVTKYPQASGTNPANIEAGPDGNMWFTTLAGWIGKMSLDGAVTPYSAGITPDAAPVGIAAGSDGNMWFTEIGSVGTVDSAIARITPSGTVTEFPLGSAANSNPIAITAAANGNIWSNEQQAPNIVEVTTGVAAASSAPQVSGVTSSSANVAGVVYPGGASSAVTVECSQSPLFSSPASSVPASAGSPATGTGASAVSGSCSGLQPDTPYYARFVSSNTFPGSLFSSTAWSTQTSFTTGPAIAPDRPAQQLPAGSIPAKVKNVGRTVVNKRNAVTAQGQPVTARAAVAVRGLANRGDVSCVRVIKGPKRKLTIVTDGTCSLKIRITYTAPGDVENLPLRLVATFRTKAVR